MKDHIFSPSRRRFIREAAGSFIAAPFILRKPGRELFPGSKLNHACIGVGGMMGLNDLQNFMKHQDVMIAAICDVDSDNLKKASEIVPGARRYRDWREMFEKEGDRIDSVNVTVPDHNHFIISYEAIKRRKHVYCQKPMCHDVAEVRLLTESSEHFNVVTQLGTQYASGAGDRTAVQLIKDKAIGKIRHVYLCSNRPGAIDSYRLKGPRPANGQDPPANLDWEVWIGTAPMRPYVPEIYHPVKWRAWQDFGTGWSGDIGCHIFDAVWKGLGLKSPRNVVADVQKSWQESRERKSDTWPQSDHITWMFPGNDLTDLKLLPVEWFDGEIYPPKEIRDLLPGKEYPAESAMLTGSEGALLIPHRGMPVLLPESRFRNFTLPKFESRNHYHHFVDACLGRTKTESNFSLAGPMAEAILLGTVAIRVPDKLLEWDRNLMKFPNYPSAGRYLKRSYRKGWEVNER
jgi:predicted dehydrogenase